jgi:hypothetical protein
MSTVYGLIRSTTAVARLDSGEGQQLTLGDNNTVIIMMYTSTIQSVFDPSKLPNERTDRF